MSLTNAKSYKNGTKAEEYVIDRQTFDFDK